MAASGVSADQKDKPAPPPKAAAKMPAAPKGNAAKGGGTPKKGGAVMNNPLNLVQRLSQMTPEQRDRVLEQLPPDRQAQVRQQLEKFDSRPQAAKDLVARQYQSLSALPQEKQRLLNQAINAAGRLPVDRRPLVRRELLSLRDLTPEDRAARLESADFKNTYTPEEQKILSDLANNLPPDYPMAGRK
jgi:hypothetical protein